jgi:hypothetical protein
MVDGGVSGSFHPGDRRMLKLMVQLLNFLGSTFLKMTSTQVTKRMLKLMVVMLRYRNAGCLHRVGGMQFSQEMWVTVFYCSCILAVLGCQIGGQ